MSSHRTSEKSKFSLQLDKSTDVSNLFHTINKWCLFTTVMKGNEYMLLCVGKIALAHAGKAKVQQVVSHVKFTHCIIHRKALGTKTREPVLNNVLQTATKIMNYIK